jgi:hypothetical protein
MAELAQDDVIGPVLKWEMLDISFKEGDLDVSLRGVLARMFKERRREVQSSHLGATTRSGHRNNSGPTSNIEDRVTSTNAGESNQLGSRRHRESFERRKERPSFLLSGFKLSKRICGGCGFHCFHD